MAVRVATLGLAAAALCGCDQLWSLQHIDEARVDARGDGNDQPNDIGPDSADHVDCPASYDMDSTVSPARYRYIGTLTSWDIGLTMCQNDDIGRTHLVVLSDEAERLDILSLLVQRSANSSVWIGFSDRRSEGNFQWVTDEPVGSPEGTPPWDLGQPDNQGGAQNCVHIVGATGYFDDSQCNSGYYVLCECDGIPPDANNY